LTGSFLAEINSPLKNISAFLLLLAADINVGMLAIIVAPPK
jgi:hypothetical protein